MHQDPTDVSLDDTADLVQPEVELSVADRDARPERSGGRPAVGTAHKGTK